MVLSTTLSPWRNSTINRMSATRWWWMMIVTIVFLLKVVDSWSFGGSHLVFIVPKNLFAGIPQLFKKNNSIDNDKEIAIEAQKLALLTAITGTTNGKTATPQQQIQILQLVQELEVTQPNISISDPNVGGAMLNGTWYLQYTSPSTILLENTVTTTSTNDDTATIKQQPQKGWEPNNNAVLENVETQPFQARGTVSAAGITLDTSNKLVQQIFQVQEQRVLNQITFSPTLYAIAGGTYRPSTIQPNRAIVAFDTAQIRLSIGKGNDDNFFTIVPLGWFFTVLSFFRKDRNRDNGWLETTFIDPTLRIGRGNKGTMFVLTREPLSLS